jgi:hypothetical protein
VALDQVSGLCPSFRFAEISWARGRTKGKAQSRFSASRRGKPRRTSAGRAVWELLWGQSRCSLSLCSWRIRTSWEKYWRPSLLATQMSMQRAARPVAKSPRRCVNDQLRTGDRRPVHLAGTVHRPSSHSCDATRARWCSYDDQAPARSEFDFVRLSSGRISGIFVPE